MSKFIRIGNDINITWSIKRYDQDESFTGKSVSVLLIDKYDHKQKFDYTISGNKIIGTYYGKDQYHTGNYRIMLVENEGRDDMVTLDYIDCFILCKKIKNATSTGNDVSDEIVTETVELTSFINNGSNVNLDDYYTKNEVDELIEDVVAGDIDLTEYAKVEDVAICISAALDTTVYDKEHIDSSFEDVYDKIDNIVIPEVNLDGYATETWVQGQNYLKEHQSLNDYLKKSDASATYQAKGNYALKTEIPNLNGYATETWVNNRGFVTELPDLTPYALKTLIPTDFYSKNEVDVKIDDTTAAIPTKTSQLVNDSNFIDKMPDLSKYATQTWVTNAIAAAELGGEEVDLSGYLTIDGAAKAYQPKGNYLTSIPGEYITESELVNYGYATADSVPTATSQLTNDSGFLTKHQSLAGYATEAWVDSLGYLTNHQSLTAYLTKTAAANTYQPIGDYLTEHQSLKDYIKTSEADNKYQPKGNYLTEHLSLANYATQAYVTNAIANAQLGGDEVDLSGYLTTEDAAKTYQVKGNYLTEHQSLADYALKSEIPSLSGYATQTWVNNQKFLKEHLSLDDYALKSEIPSLSGYATQTWVNNKGYLTAVPNGYVKTEDLDDYALKTDIPSLSGYATQTWVNNQKFLKEHQSLAGYATETWVTEQGYLTSHQSLAAYLKKTDASSLYQPKGNYLTEHQSLDGYLTTAVADTKYQDKGTYLTEHQSLSDYAKKTDLFSKNYNDLTNKPTIPSVTGLISETTADSKYQPKGTYLTEHQSLDNCVKKTETITLTGITEDGITKTYTIYGIA